MPEQFITCPYCGKKISLSDALSQDIKENIRKELETEILKSEQEAVKKVTEKFDQEKKLLEDDLKTKERKLEESQKAELELRKRQKEVEEKEKELDLVLARRLDEERQKIKEEAEKNIFEENRLKELEREKLISDMKVQIETLKRKAEQGSQQTQGEVLELEIEEILKANFPFDSVEPVAKGVRGADVIQKVNNQSGQYCGLIIWESKRTKAWSDGWIQKLKDDQRECNAELAVIVTTVLPKNVKTFSLIEGVWVTNFETLISLATALRINLIQLANAKLMAVGKNEKMEVIYNYLTSTQFKQKVEAIVEAFKTMQADLMQEKRAVQKNWAKREKQIQRVIDNTITMYGEMQGIMGASLPEIESLEMKALTEGDDSEEMET